MKCINKTKARCSYAWPHKICNLRWSVIRCSIRSWSYCSLCGKVMSATEILCKQSITFKLNTKWTLIPQMPSFSNHNETLGLASKKIVSRLNLIRLWVRKWEKIPTLLTYILPFYFSWLTSHFLKPQFCSASSAQNSAFPVSVYQAWFLRVKRNSK